jgi:hypothetical protein
MFVYNNIFSSTNGSGMGHQNTIVRNNDTPFFMSNNLFEGTVDSRWVAMDAKPQIGSPLFDSLGVDKDQYWLEGGSPAVDNGTPVPGPAVLGAGYGVFENIPVYPDVDFYGNPIDLVSGTPNIGACNVKYDVEENMIVSSDTSFSGDTITIIDSTVTCKTYSKTVPSDPEYTKTICDTSISIKTIIQEDTTSTIVKSVTRAQNNWLVYPDPANSRIQMISQTNISGDVHVSLVDLRGKIVQTFRKSVHPGENEFVLKLESGLSNGIYILNIRNKSDSHSRRIVLY